MQETLNILLIDDEPEACENLDNIISQFINEKINILGYAHSTQEAEQKIKKFKPDAVFLDIEMPNENAFQFLERLGDVDFEIVFVTAYDEYAIRAFKLNAVYYVLKPINIDELTTAVDKLKSRIHMKNIVNKSAEYRNDYVNIAEQITNKKQQQHIVLSDSNHWESVLFSNIIYVKAMGSYSKIFYINDSGSQSIIISRSISEYENMLPEELFFRVHRSFLVNCQYVQKILKGETKLLLLSDKTQLPIGRRRFAELVNFLKHHGITQA